MFTKENRRRRAQNACRVKRAFKGYWLLIRGSGARLEREEAKADERIITFLEAVSCVTITWKGYYSFPKFF